MEQLLHKLLVGSLIERNQNLLYNDFGKSTETLGRFPGRNATTILLPSSHRQTTMLDNSAKTKTKKERGGRRRR